MKPLKFWVLLITTTSLLLACSTTDRPTGAADIRSDIAGSYGIASFGQIDEIRYTFNVKLGEKQVKRSWIWWPKSDRVEYWPGGDHTKAVRYSRNDLNASVSDEIKKIDAVSSTINTGCFFPFIWSGIGKRPWRMLVASRCPSADKAPAAWSSPIRPVGGTRPVMCMIFSSARTIVWFNGFTARADRLNRHALRPGRTIARSVH
jgi:hypothetical protein